MLSLLVIIHSSDYLLTKDLQELLNRFKSTCGVKLPVRSKQLFVVQDNFSREEKDNSLAWFKIVMSLFSFTEVVNDLKDIFKFQLLVLAHFISQLNGFKQISGLLFNRLFIGDSNIFFRGNNL